MEYISQFIDEIKKEFESLSIHVAVGLTKGHMIAVLIHEKEWTLEDDAKVLFGIKKMGVKIHTFIHIFKGSYFPKISEINQKDLPLEIYDCANSLMVGLKKPELSMATTARDLNTKTAKLFYPKTIDEAVRVFNELIS